MRRRRNIRKGMIIGIVLGSIVSAWMWYLLDGRESQKLMTMETPKYKAQLALQKFSEATTQDDKIGQLYHLEAAVNLFPLELDTPPEASVLV